MTTSRLPAPGAHASPAAALPVFPNYTEMPSLLPAWAWRALRACSVAGAVALAVLLLVDAELGLLLFWGLVVPVLPLVFMFTPGLWRNLCPLATSNQMPRRLGMSQGWTQKTLSQGRAYPIGIALLVGGVIGRKLLFNLSGQATAALILGAMLAAFIGGLLYKGKSGWCSSICPLLPVQRLYGQTPFIKIANTQCESCVGCAKNCYDFNPGVAWLADQYDPNPNYRNFRRFFASIFPGLILGYYLVPGVEQIGAAAVVLHMALYMAGSLSLITLIDLLVGTTRNWLPVVAAALAVNLYYWFAAPLVTQVLQRLGVHPDLTLVGGVRAAVGIGSLLWVARSLQVERLFLNDQLRRSGEGEIPLAPVVVETVRLNPKVIAISPAPAGAPDGAAAAERTLHETDLPVDVPADAATDAALPATANSATAEPAAAGPAAPHLGRPELRIEPQGLVTALRAGRSLLDLLEGCGADIHPGCRAGACGADPIAVTGGADCLSSIGDTERATLARLGHASNTRLACMARVRRAGPVTVELQPHAAGRAVLTSTGEPLDQPSDPASGAGAPQDSQPAPLTVPAALSQAAHSAPPGGVTVPPTPSTTATLPTLHQAIGRLDRGARGRSDGPANEARATPAAAGAIRRVVIVGNGVAGLTAAEEIRRHQSDCDIHLIARERHLSYNRMSVSALINRRNGMQGLFLKPDAWYDEQRIQTWLNTRATGLDTLARTLTLASGEVLEWDRLIIATGAHAWVPPIEGFGIGGCSVLRVADDAMALRAFVHRHRVRRAAVVGAGLLGLEAAAALAQMGLAVRVLSLNDRVLDRQIDAPASALVVRHLGDMGIEFVANAQLRGVASSRKGRVAGLRLEDGRHLDTELLLLCAGTRADLSLARAGGLAVGRGITVDASMQTSARHVYAAGDVAELDGRAWGLWGVAADQGRVAALTALGLAARHEAAPPVTALKLAGIQVRAAGLAEARTAGQIERRLDPMTDPSDSTDPADPIDLALPAGPAEPWHGKLVIEDQQVVGAVFVGDDPQADDWLQAASRRTPVAQLRELLAERSRLTPATGIAAGPALGRRVA